MKKIGKYVIKGLLGKGGMGRVFKVETPVINRISALKLLHPDPMLSKLMGSDALIHLFIHEAKTMAEIRHPNIVNILDFEQSEESYFYVMEYYCNNLGILMGESYAVEAPSRILPVEKAIDYLAQILSGLLRLHFSGIVHRDIKPFNILITDDDNLKICDFGLSKYRGESFRGPLNLHVGSPFYTAPEQEKSADSADFTADIYSAGVIFYRMLTGELPRSSSDTDQWTPPSIIHPYIDSSFDEFISKATSSKKEERFQSADEMLQSLKSLSSTWKHRKESECRLHFTSPLPPKPPLPPVPRSSQPPATIRSLPLKIPKFKSCSFFGLTELFRPKNYCVNRFMHLSSQVIYDESTSLIWQQSGSPYPLTWQKAHEYIKMLNIQRFEDRANWRLPTIDELITILSELHRPEDLCLESCFDRTQKWIWSGDRQSYLAAWFVSMELGFIGSQDFTAYYYVKAVSSP